MNIVDLEAFNEAQLTAKFAIETNDSIAWFWAKELLKMAYGL